MPMIIYIVNAYICILSVIGFASMGFDKRKAIRKMWRIPESTLILIALFGGGIGSYVGMKLFHHKTKHKKFIILLPLTATVYIVVLLKINQML